MKIGMIGAESKHVEFFSTPINRDKFFGNARVSCIWGGDTTEDRLLSCSSSEGIEQIAKTPSEVIDSSEAVIITLRNGNMHAEYALECIKKRKPVFIDKPFTVDPADGFRILETAREYGTPFTGGSTLCFLPEIPILQDKFISSSEAEISYRADPNSPYGGWYFYGSHLTDLCATICGQNATAVKADISREHVIADVFYRTKENCREDASRDVCPWQPTANKKVQIYSAPDLPQPIVKMKETHILDDTACYFYGLKAFFDVISSNSSPDADRLLFSVKLMDAIMRSAAAKSVVTIEA